MVVPTRHPWLNRSLPQPLRRVRPSRQGFRSTPRTSESRTASKKHGSYNCGCCGLPKKGHDCTGKTAPTPTSASSATPSHSSFSAVSAPSSGSASRCPLSHLRRAISFDEDEAGRLDLSEPVDVRSEEDDLDSSGLSGNLLWEVLRKLPPTRLCNGSDGEQRLEGDDKEFVESGGGVELGFGNGVVDNIFFVPGYSISGFVVAQLSAVLVMWIEINGTHTQNSYDSCGGKHNIVVGLPWSMLAVGKSCLFSFIGHCWLGIQEVLVNFMEKAVRFDVDLNQVEVKYHLEVENVNGIQLQTVLEAMDRDIVGIGGSRSDFALFCNSYVLS
ncbi:F-box/LRR-repeat protein 17 [Glycine soja]